jgi:hypothetical protein
MLNLIVLVCMFAIVLYGIVNIFTMQDSPNPNCFQEEDIECKCPLQCESNDQRNT